MNEQTTLEKLKAINEWIYTNEAVIKQEDLSVVYSILSTNEGEDSTNVSSVYITSEDELWFMIYDMLKEFYSDHEQEETFAEYLSRFQETLLAMDEDNTIDLEQSYRYKEDNETD